MIATSPTIALLGETEEYRETQAETIQRLQRRIEELERGAVPIEVVETGDQYRRALEIVTTGLQQLASVSRPGTPASILIAHLVHAASIGLDLGAPRGEAVSALVRVGSDARRAGAAMIEERLAVRREDEVNNYACA